jgi:hypothetical protein
MSDDQGQDWKKALAREAAESESGRLAKLQAAASEFANAQLLKRQAEAAYSSKTLALFEEIKNKATDILNEVSRDARPAPSASPVPVNSYCFEIWRQFPAGRQPGSQFEEPAGTSRYVTKVNFDTSHRMIVVTHMQGFGPEGRFAVEEAAPSGELFLKADAEVISVDELVKRICVPIFRVKGPSA